MTEDRFRKYDELEDDEKEVFDVFRYETTCKLQ